MENILTVKDVAGILKVRDITVREMFRAQRLRGFKIGKSWRTTQKLFEEDLAALMSGRAPETMPTPKAPSKPRKKAKRSASKEPAPAPEPMPDPAVEETSARVESEAAPTSTT